MKLITLVASFAVLGACSEPLNHADDYLSRLENVLDRDADRSLSTGLHVSFPDQKKLEISPPVFELSIKEFLGMRQCRLHTIVAQRNSQLGKVATDSQRLFNDLEILSLGPTCIEKLGDSTLANKLSSFIAKKEAYLNTAAWQAILASQEHRSFWHDKRLSKDYPNDLALKLTKELLVLSGFLAAIQNGERHFTKQDQSEIERALGQLRLGDGGHLLAEFVKLSGSLERANSVIQKRLDSPLCHRQQVSQQAKYFSNVVNQYFIGKVQARSVKLEQRARVLMPLISDIEKHVLAYSTPEYRSWAQARDKQFKIGRAATLKHARLIQELYQQCGLSPGVPKD